MTSQSLKKLRTTLRRTFSKFISVADNGMSVLTAVVASGLVLSGLTASAFADGWQGKHSSAPAVYSAAPSAPAAPAPSPKAETSSAKVHLVAYTAAESSNNLKWAQPQQAPQAIGVKTIRRTVRRTVPAPSADMVAQNSSAYSDPFGDRPARASAYGVPAAPKAAPNAGTVPPALDTNMPDVSLPDGAVMPELESVPTPPGIDAMPDAMMDDAPIPTTQPFQDGAPAAPALEDVPGTELAPESTTAPAEPAIPTSDPLAPTAPSRPVSPSRSAGNTSVTPPTTQIKPRDIEAPFISSGEDPRNRMKETCPPVSSIKPISQISTDIAASEGEFPKECTLGDEPFAGRHFQPTCYTWAAPGLAINPLYFEEPALERYGHSCGTILQPIVSAGHFVLTVPALPWLMAIDPPNECQYVLGYYRPGECAPYVLDPIPFSVRAAVVEGGIATALIFLIP